MQRFKDYAQARLVLDHSLAIALAVCCWCGVVRSDRIHAVLADEAKPGPEKSAHNESPQTIQFDAGEIKGTIRLDGAYHGVTELVDKRSGRQVIDPRYSALNLFKLMSVNLMMGQPRRMEREVRSGDGWAEIRWPATPTFRGEVRARYEVRPPNAVDLSVTAQWQGVYPAFEVFLSSYFDKTLEPHVYLKSRRAKPPELVLPMVSDVFRGTVLVFGRDPLAARHCLDGRWERSEGGVPVVQMCPVRYYADCLAMLVDHEKTLAVLLMADPRDCYALSTRYFAEDDVDRLSTYSAFDFSLFGTDAVPDAQQTVRVRVAVTPLDKDFSQPLKLYRDFLAETDNASDSGASP